MYLRIVSSLNKLVLKPKQTPNGVANFLPSTQFSVTHK